MAWSRCGPIKQVPLYLVPTTGTCGPRQVVFIEGEYVRELTRRTPNCNLTIQSHLDYVPACEKTGFWQLHRFQYLNGVDNCQKPSKRHAVPKCHVSIFNELTVTMVIFPGAFPGGPFILGPPIHGKSFIRSMDVQNAKLPR